MGNVYFIKPVYRRGPIKIGRAKNVLKRLSALQTSHFDQLHVFAVIECDDDAALEQEFHRCYSGNRGRGEWFVGSDGFYRHILSISGIHTPIQKDPPYNPVWPEYLME